MKKILVITFVIFGLIIAYIMNATLIEKRSLSSRIAQDVMAFMTIFSENSILESLDESAKKAKSGKIEPGYVLPDNLKLNNSIALANYEGMDVYVINEESKNDIVVFYIHGGAYFGQISEDHIYFNDYIAEKIDVMTIMPIYPLSPYNTAEDSYAVMLDYYKELLKTRNSEDIIFVGDSAGGGYCMGLSMLIREHSLPQPKEIIVMSPWLDVTLDNERVTNHLDKKDVMLSKELLLKAGEYWAGDKNPKDWLISPIYGDFEDLPPVTTYVGTYELLYPDCVLMHEKLDEAGNDNKIIVYDKMIHVFPMFDSPESREAKNEIIDIIKDMN